MSAAQGNALGKVTLVAVAAAVVVILARPCLILGCDPTRGSRTVATMKSDLSHLVDAQEAHRLDHGVYAAHVDSLEYMTVHGGGILEIGDVTAGGWTAYAASTMTAFRCAIFVGDAPPPRKKAVAGTPICWKDDSLEFRRHVYTITLGRSLESLGERQRAYYKEHGVYATDPRALNFSTRSDLVAEITVMSPRRWRVTLTKLELALRCDLEVTYPPGTDEPNVGEPRCAVDSTAVRSGYATILKRELGYLDSLQRTYYAEHGRYAGTMDSLTYMPDLEVVFGDAHGWHATALQEESPVRCEIFVGTVPDHGAGMVEGEPSCTTR